MASRKSTRLSLEALETREVPANINITAVGGIYTLTGDAADSEVQLHGFDGNIGLVGGANTTFTFNGLSDYPAIDLFGVNGLRMNLGGGNDTVKIYGSNQLSFDKTLTIDLGNGDNLVDLRTSYPLQLGTVRIKAGPGVDTVHIRGGVESTVSRLFDASLGDGDNVFQTEYMPYFGAGLKITNGLGQLQTVQVNSCYLFGALSTTFNGVEGKLNIKDSDVNRVTGRGVRILTEFTNSRVTGDVSLTGEFVDVIVDSCPVWTGDYSGRALEDSKLYFRGTSNVDADIVPPTIEVSAGNIATIGFLPLMMQGAPLSKLTGNANIRVNGTEAAYFNLNSASFEAGSVSLKSQVNASFGSLNQTAIPQISRISNNLILSAPTAGISLNNPLIVSGDVRVTGGTGVLLTVDYGDLAVGGDLSFATTNFLGNLETGGVDVTGDWNIRTTRKAELSVAALAFSRVGGNFNLRGGSQADSIVILNAFRVDQNANFNMGGGDDYLVLASTNPAYFYGNLRMSLGSGGDTVLMKSGTVAGATSMLGGGGNDALSLHGSTFRGAFYANMAAGNDAVQFAFLTTQTAPLTFEGMVTVQGGSGVDSLLLGNSSGDTYSIVNFTATSKFIGGPGIDTFDPTAAEVTGTATVTW